MGGGLRTERGRGDRAPARTKSRRATDPRLDVAWMAPAVRREYRRDARDVGAARCGVDRAGLFRHPRIACFRVHTRIAPVGIAATGRGRHDDSGDCGAYLRGKSRHDKILARGADVSGDDRGGTGAGRDVSPRAARRRSRELRCRRNSYRARDRRELLGAVSAGDRSGLAGVRTRPNPRRR